MSERFRDSLIKLDQDQLIRRKDRLLRFSQRLNLRVSNIGINTPVKWLDSIEGDRELLNQKRKLREAVRGLEIRVIVASEELSSIDLAVSKALENAEQLRLLESMITDAQADPELVPQQVVEGWQTKLTDLNRIRGEDPLIQRGVRVIASREQQLARTEGTLPAGPSALGNSTDFEVGKKEEAEKIYTVTFPDGQVKTTDSESLYTTVLLFINSYGEKVTNCQEIGEVIGIDFVRDKDKKSRVYTQASNVRRFLKSTNWGMVSDQPIIDQDGNKIPAYHLVKIEKAIEPIIGYTTSDPEFDGSVLVVSEAPSLPGQIRQPDLGDGSNLGEGAFRPNILERINPQNAESFLLRVSTGRVVRGWNGSFIALVIDSDFLDINNLNLEELHPLKSEIAASALFGDENIEIRLRRTKGLLPNLNRNLLNPLGLDMKFIPLTEEDKVLGHYNLTAAEPALDLGEQSVIELESDREQSKKKRETLTIRGDTIRMVSGLRARLIQLVLGEAVVEFDPGQLDFTTLPVYISDDLIRALYNHQGEISTPLRARFEEVLKSDNFILKEFKIGIKSTEPNKRGGRHRAQYHLIKIEDKHKAIATETPVVPEAERMDELSIPQGMILGEVLRLTNTKKVYKFEHQLSEQVKAACQILIDNGFASGYQPDKIKIEEYKNLRVIALRKVEYMMRSPAIDTILESSSCEIKVVIEWFRHHPDSYLKFLDVALDKNWDNEQVLKEEIENLELLWVEWDDRRIQLSFQRAEGDRVDGSLSDDSLDRTAAQDQRDLLEVDSTGKKAARQHRDIERRDKGIKGRLLGKIIPLIDSKHMHYPVVASALMSALNINGLTIDWLVNSHLIPEKRPRLTRQQVIAAYYLDKSSKRIGGMSREFWYEVQEIVNEINKDKKS